MGRHKVVSWRDSGKIEPVLDELIKDYMDFLNMIDIPSRPGFLSLNKEGMKIIKDTKLMKKDSPYDPSKLIEKKTIKSLIKTGMSEEVDSIRDFLKAIKANKRMGPKQFVQKMRILVNIVNNLPEGPCKEYYKGKFAPFSSWHIFKQFAEKKGTTKFSEWFSDFFYAYASIIFRTGMKDYNKDNNAKLKKEELANLIKTATPYFNDLISIKTYRKTLSELVDKGKKGDISFLFKVIHIDKTLVGERWVQALIKEAQYAGKLSFFDKLSEAIKKEPIGGKIIHVDLLMILKFFWPMGIGELTIPQLRGLLKDSGFTLQQHEDTFRKFVKRYENNGFLCTK